MTLQQALSYPWVVAIVVTIAAFAVLTFGAYVHALRGEKGMAVGVALAVAGIALTYLTR